MSPPPSNTASEPTAGALLLDAEALYLQLRHSVQAMMHPDERLVGIATGGAWLAQRLQRDLGLRDEAGVLSSSMHRDDFAQRGLQAGLRTRMGFEVHGARILLLDDVLYTGRTVRAVLNELFDYGRPAQVRLAVLVDRGGRELPVQPDYCAARVQLAPDQALALAQRPDGGFAFHLERK